MKILALILSLVLILTGCQPKTNDYYASVENEEDVLPIDDGIAVSLKFTDYVNSNTVVGVSIPPENPYFKSQLSDPAQRCLEEIVLGMIDYKSYITLSHSITEEELKHVMNIIMTNVPDTFHCDFTYKYDLNVSGYINNLYPQYILDYQTYITAKSDMENGLIDKGLDKTITEYSYLSNVYKNAQGMSNALKVEKTKIKNTDIEGYISQSILGARYNSLSSLGAAKYIQYYCNYIGIESAVVLGELVNTSFDIPDIYPILEYKVKENDNMYTVSMDVNNYHAWNIVNIGGTWCNCDAWLDKYLGTKDGSAYGAFLCVPDEIIRQTRLLRVSNTILGLTPSCVSNNFQYSAREAYYVKSYSDEEIQACVDTMIENIDINNMGGASIQFETEANYLLFSRLFDERMELYNQTHNNIIPRYSTYRRDYSLRFNIGDVVFSSK